MANYNKVMLMGNLTRDPQLSYTPSQTPVVDFGLAVNRKWTGKDGQSKEDTCFVDCRAFARQAENINKYLSKGRGVFVEGRLTFGSWTAQDGTKRSKLTVTVENFQFLPRGGGSPAGDGQEDYGRTNSKASSTGDGFGDGGSGQPSGADDIPF